MEITPEIKKSFDSAFYGIECRGNGETKPKSEWVVYYEGKPFLKGIHGRIKTFGSQNKAIKFVIQWVESVFWHGEYWNQKTCRDNIKNETGVEMDFSGTINILSSYGETARFESAENKAMFSALAQELLDKGTVVIKQLK